MPAELNLGTTIAAVADRLPQRPAIVQGNLTLTYRQFLDRATRFARFLREQGLGRTTAERDRVPAHLAGQHRIAQYLHNGPEYLEGMVGSYRARLVPFNVNYRYHQAELLYLLLDSDPSVIQYHARFATTLAPILASLRRAPLLVRVDDGSGVAPLPGALDYEQVLASVPPRIHVEPSARDLYLIYTGGTTGMPKGVLWHQADAAISLLGLRNGHERREWDSLDELLDALPERPHRVLPCAPLMHGAGQWTALRTLCSAGTVVLPECAESFDAAETLAAVARHRVTTLAIVGDAFARPLIQRLERGEHDASSLRVVVSGGAALHPSSKDRWLQLVPDCAVLEVIGSSESGVQGRQQSDQTSASGPTEFVPSEDAMVMSPDLTRFLRAGHDGVGWLASRGRIPLGYLGDERKTAQAFPVVDGLRVSVPGDRARLLDNGRIQLLGRDSMTINTGGEKVFPEQVEAVLQSHSAVLDAVVCGRPSQRWGVEVSALVVPTGPLALDELTHFCRTRLSGYKVPKTVVFVSHIERGPMGKPDYRWAAKQLTQPANPDTATRLP